MITILFAVLFTVLFAALFTLYFTVYLTAYCTVYLTVYFTVYYTACLSANPRETIIDNRRVLETKKRRGGGNYMLNRTRVLRTSAENSGQEPSWTSNEVGS